MKKYLLVFIIIVSILFAKNLVLADSLIPVKPIGTQTTNKSIYTLLAPIQNLTCVDTSSNPDPKCASGGIGGYFNILLNVMIGLAAVLAVIMIIINAVKYMGGDSVFSKEEGQHGITAAITGLIIALGSYALLNTINPALLGQGGLQIDQVTINEEPILSDAGKPIPPSGASVGTCTQGIVAIYNFHACADIADRFKNMLDAAKAANINLTGGGFRTRDEQIALRNKHCNGNTTDRNATCTPPTALPGNSNHESGHAFDLKCDGSKIASKDNKCFVWLNTNASNYGLRNLASEPWHWSIDGR